ncbi:DNA-binding transcriptional regulator [Pseudomonas syringae pv. actinidiae]|uniref:DNA-binding transcriptional regulator n=1 Tax=Pseudomonas syringae pv. actinidiae TaxID=103796 RepID=A0AAN4Q419_PSESF|nr:DNA-binding transcriptional regulator [Pseudomonas syringae pv. actinidiae]
MQGAGGQPVTRDLDAGRITRVPGKQTADALLRCLLHQSHCFAQCGAGWFFHQHMLACGQRLPHKRKSTLRRCAERNGVNVQPAFEQFA